MSHSDGEITQIGPGGDTLPISSAVVHNGLLYISGHVGFAPGTSLPISDDLAEQTWQTLRDLDEVMREAGTGRDRIVMMRIHLADVQRDFAAMNQVFREWIGSHRPARTTVGSELAVAGLLIEIDAVVAVA